MCKGRPVLLNLCGHTVNTLYSSSCMYILNLFCAVEVTQIYSLNLEGKTPWQREGILRKASVFTEALYPQSMVLLPQQS